MKKEYAVSARWKRLHLWLILLGVIVYFLPLLFQPDNFYIYTSIGMLLILAPIVLGNYRFYITDEAIVVTGNYRKMDLEQIKGYKQLKTGIKFIPKDSRARPLHIDAWLVKDRQEFENWVKENFEQL